MSITFSVFLLIYLSVEHCAICSMSGQYVIWSFPFASKFFVFVLWASSLLAHIILSSMAVAFFSFKCCFVLACDVVLHVGGSWDRGVAIVVHQ